MGGHLTRAVLEARATQPPPGLAKGFNAADFASEAAAAAGMQANAWFASALAAGAEAPAAAVCCGPVCSDDPAAG